MLRYFKSFIFLVSLLMVMTLIISGCGQKEQAGQAGTAGSKDTVVKFPEREITLEVGLPPGGNADLQARALSQAANKYLKKQIIVVNKAGAGGITALTELAKTKPDGYTIELAPDSLFTVQPIINKDLGYKIEDFDFMMSPTSTPVLLSVNSNSPYKTLDDLIADAKATNKVITFAHSGEGSHLQLVGLTFFQAAGVKHQQVPFSGSGPALTALLGEKVDVLSTNLGSIDSQIKAGKVRPLVSTSLNRMPNLPDVPTMKEKGYDILSTSRMVLLAPKGIPEEAKDVLSDAFQKAANDPEFKATMESLFASVDILDSKGTLDYINQIRLVDQKTIDAMPKN